MLALAFWNNKGGTGKTSLAFQSICQFAYDNAKARILVLDVCPQANLSELLLGGLEGEGSRNLLLVQGSPLRTSVGGYFQTRLPRPYDPGSFSSQHFITKPAKYNSEISSNIDLVAGDPLLELQANAMSTLANNQIPGTNTWIRVISWLRDFLEPIKDSYDFVFIDTNPSFSIYTQIALASAQRLVLPVMADDSSRRAIQNAFSLIYGLKLPSEIYAQHMFAARMNAGELPLPQVHLLVKNRITQYMGPASGYAAVLKSIDDDLEQLMKTMPSAMTFSSLDNAVVEVRDFQTTGVVAFARGTPFFGLRTGKLSIGDRRVSIDAEQRRECINAVKSVSQRLF
jgi:cellulose biosynthesis protein BcsQ